MSQGPLWQIEQAIKANKLLLQANRDDIKRAQQREADTIKELGEYERAYELLQPMKETT